MKQVLIGLAAFFLVITCVAGWFLYSKTTENSDLKAKLSEAEAGLAESQNKLAQIEKVYPLRYFENKNELNQWLSEQPKAPSDSNVAYWYIAGLQLLDRATKDGYTGISVAMDNFSVGYGTIVYAVTQDKRVYTVDLCNMVTIDSSPLWDITIVEGIAYPSITWSPVAGDN